MRVDWRIWWLVGTFLFLSCGGLIFATYWFGWSKTGFLNKSLWDWMQLLIIPVVLAAAGFWLSRNERKATEKRADTEREIASDNQREEALQTYILMVRSFFKEF